MASSRSSVVRVVLWVVGTALVLGVGFAAWIAVPILTGSPQGSSGQERDVRGFPLEVSAIGDDGRERFLSVTPPSPDRGLDEVRAGDRLIVSGRGYDPSSGVYVAVCQVPSEVDGKPGPCLGGVGSTDEGEAIANVIEYGASNWINDDWAWRLFGARSFDDREAGTFKAYIAMPEVSDGTVDCGVVRCGLYTRNDHTALEDRVQDIYIPVSFEGAAPFAK